MGNVRIAPALLLSFLAFPNGAEARVRNRTLANAVGAVSQQIPTGDSDRFVVSIDQMRAIWTSECGRRRNSRGDMPAFCNNRDEVYFKVIGRTRFGKLEMRVPPSGSKMPETFGGADYYGFQNGDRLRPPIRTIVLWAGVVARGEAVQLTIAMFDQENDQLAFIKQVFKSLASLAFTAITGGAALPKLIEETVKVGYELGKSFASSRHQLLGNIGVLIRNQGRSKAADVHWVLYDRLRVSQVTGPTARYNPNKGGANYDIQLSATRDCLAASANAKAACEKARLADFKRPASAPQAQATTSPPTNLPPLSAPLLFAPADGAKVNLRAKAAGFGWQVNYLARGWLPPAYRTTYKLCVAPEGVMCGSPKTLVVDNVGGYSGNNYAEIPTAQLKALGVKSANWTVGACRQGTCVWQQAVRSIKLE